MGRYHRDRPLTQRWRLALTDWERQQRAWERDEERRRKAEERARIAAEKEQHQRYVEARQAEITAKNRGLEETIIRLQEILRHGLMRSARIHLRSLLRQPQIPPLDLGELEKPIPKPVWEAPPSPGLVSRAFGGNARYARSLADAKEAFDRAEQKHKEQETARQQWVVAARRDHAAQVKDAEESARQHNESITALMQGFQQREKRAVEDYFQRILTAVPVPYQSTRKIEVTFSPRAEQIVVRFELPSRDVVPTVASYKYLPTKNEERTTGRNSKEVDNLYRSVISQVALLCIRDLLDSDPTLASVGFNGHVHATNPATGEREYVCLISMSVDRETFPKDENLREVNPEACVRHLKAIVSNHPYEWDPIEPILDFDLSKYSFVEGFDAVSTLDSRPDLMDMSSSNFEHLVRQIFEAQGAEGWTTERSNDDGVDAVIVRRTPLIGGLSIVQAKRHSRVVGVNHIRELAGAIEEKKAGWGILVTTSWFTAGGWQKAREHGRMELIDGERLTYLIKEHLGKDVLIGIPDRPRSNRVADN